MTNEQRPLEVDLRVAPDDSPLVSVLIVNYNYARFLPEAVDSVLGQTYRNFEIVICDDGSTDSSRDVISSYRDRHPGLVKSVFKANGGVASALNAAYASSSGDVVSILDADDRFLPTKLERVVEAFASDQRVGLVVNPLIKFGSGRQMTGLIPQVGRLDSGWIRDDMLASGGHWSFAPASGISLRRSCADLVFPVPEQTFRTEADSYIFTQAPMHQGVKAVEEPLSLYRLHSSNVTSVEHIDAAYARRIMDGIERFLAELEASARARGLRLPHVDDNPTYVEMALLKHYLEGAPKATIAGDILRLWRAAYRCRAADRLRWRLKPWVLTPVVFLPRSLGHRIIEAMYLPTASRQSLAGLLVKWQSRRHKVTGE
jgi:glycosyltransferase involved in cell wall biosynthesis